MPVSISEQGLMLLFNDPQPKRLALGSVAFLNTKAESCEVAKDNKKHITTAGIINERRAFVWFAIINLG